MRRIFPVFLFLSLILSACSEIPAAPQIASPGSPEMTSPASPAATEPSFPLPTTAVPDSKPISTVGTPHIEQGPDGAITAAPPDTQNCGYQWAYQDLPELSSSFQQSLQALQPESQATAFAFGENCILSDGSVGAFLPMETDFNVTLQVSDINNESNLGDWIVKVMQVIDSIPSGQILGPRPGRVTLAFQAGDNQKNLSFYIDQYHKLPPDLTPLQVFTQLASP
jgi:hypothetical protein